MRKNIFIALLILSNVFLINAKLLAGSVIEGKIIDGVTGEPLWGANVVLMGTSMGAATDEKGFYRINGVNPGEYMIRASFIGYTGPDVKIVVKDGVHIEQNFNLQPVGLQGETVVVTAQAYGQAQAINQQLTSDKIVNVVSAAKIKELPDANAAESVGRLPGVSIIRSGGEGYGVVIRGLQPKYNTVTVDGIQMASTNAYDRSSDLSMISSDMLNGIEVSKTLTADMDAAVIGGVVNFDLREAKTDVPGVPVFNLEVQGSYDGLSNIDNKFNNYKYVGSAENRFFNEKLGVFAQVGVERKNLSSNFMGATYTTFGNDESKYSTTDLSLTKRNSDRNRYNGALVIDYKLPEGSLKLTNLLSTGKTKSLSRGINAVITTNYANYDLQKAENEQTIITNGLGWEQHVLNFDIETKVSHSYTESINPGTWTATFLQASAGLEGLQSSSNLDPKNIMPMLSNDISQAVLQTFDTDYSFSKERILNASLDIKRDIRVSDLVSVQLKFGGKFKYQKRSYNYTIYDGTLNGGGESMFITPFINNHFGLPNPTGDIYMKYFLENYEYGDLYGGDYKMTYALDNAKLNEMASLLRNNVDLFAANNNDGGFGYNLRSSLMNDHSGEEYHSAFYVMTTINIGPQITLIPGVRYQNLETRYTGNRGRQQSDITKYPNYDTTVTQVHGYWLPDVSLKYKPVEWCDIRLSYTNSLTYPDYYNLIPYISLAYSTSYFGNYKLKPSRSANYDAYVSFYNNSIGLFTIGGFLKEIKDFVYGKTFSVSNEAALPYLPASLLDGAPVGKYSVGTYINHPYTIKDYGMELDWQTHFWYLPGPLSGLVFNVNYTHIFSKAEYPYVKVVRVGRQMVEVDTAYTDRLLHQPDDIINFSLGYDYKDFSMRVSMLYQTDISSGNNQWPQLRAHTSAYRRWDISAKQMLPWYNIELYGNIYNLTGVYDISVIAAGGVPTSQEEYGLVANLGMRIKI